MSEVTYTGSSDFQIFSAADFEKADVKDQNKVTFAKGVPTEVSKSAAKALVSDDGIFGPYSFEEAEQGKGSEADGDGEDDKGDDDVVLDDEPVTSGEAATTEGTADPSLSTEGGKKTGKGSSTRNR